ncbi:MAG: succinyl-diaminopimelate desuccinylase [Pseudomonadota bacterium]|nr:succinyl-diaminopimelate desuccinylase [Pseudomonadota bacterium]
MIDPVTLASALIACPSITPATGAVFDVLEAALLPLGFEVHRFTRGDPMVENLVALRGSGGPHFGFAGHLDVVPAGDGWDHDPFDPHIRDGVLTGRGANDMKSAIAAFVAAAAAVPIHDGTLSLLITGDEEGPATDGTVAIIDWLAERAIKPDMILIGEPTSETCLGDTIKIGRRGSVNMWIEVPGTQGHVAYPHLAANPIGALARIVAELDGWILDQGNDAFPPSNLELTEIITPPGAPNLIPARAAARLNIRFNNLQRGADLVERVREVMLRHAPGATLRALISGEAFLTPPGTLYDLVASAIRDELGIEPRLSTSGGTSDGRFLYKLCPVVDFGLPNATMHKVGEQAAVADIAALSRIYARIIAAALA